MTQAWIASSHPSFVEDTFRLICDSADDTNLQVQVRSSQATKELSTFLLCPDNTNRADPTKVKQLLALILKFAKSDKLKVAANALRALGFFLAAVVLPLVLDTHDGVNYSSEIREVI